ncbi:MAG: nucleoside deaminase, partial [Candidatus Methanoperedens sp.]|nr:nucleoside deaminase [Candidatus Methanoperedens sp.]
LLDYKFNDACPDDKYVWLKNVLALKGVDSGNFGVGCILVDFHGNVVVQGHNEVFNPYFRSDRHAEMVVMDEFEDTHRDIPMIQGFTLYTSLESCPMCFVRLITSGVNKVL